MSVYLSFNTINIAYDYNKGHLNIEGGLESMKKKLMINLQCIITLTITTLVWIIGG